MKHLLILFLISFSLIFPFLLCPNVTAAETEYVPLVTYEDDTNGLFAELWTYFDIISIDGNKVLRETRTNTGTAYQSADVPALPDSFEISFDFTCPVVGTNGYSLFCINEDSSGTTYDSVNLGINGFGYFTVQGINSTFMVKDSNWHSVFVNVTTAGSIFQSRISIDGSPLSAPYNCGSSSWDEYVIVGNVESTGFGSPMWDNILVASRLGSLPTADLTYTPKSGDGLTNILFTDNSTVDSIPFKTLYYWDFGDGNYTYGTPGGTVNHTYIHAGTYQVILNVSNRLGYDLAYTNITVTGISIGGGDEVSDDMFGFIALLAMITALNLYAMKSSTGLLSIFALMGLIISASLLWPDSPITTALLMVTVLGNIAITIKTVT